MASKKNLSAKENVELLNELKERFEKNMARHKSLKWTEVEAKLAANPDKLWSVSEMERTGGEPDVVELGKDICFVDCSPESPKGRRSLCYDRAAWESRMELKP
jgi:hypothetical protein